MLAAPSPWNLVLTLHLRIKVETRLLGHTRTKSGLGARTTDLLKREHRAGDLVYRCGTLCRLQGLTLRIVRTSNSCPIVGLAHWTSYPLVRFLSSLSVLLKIGRTTYTAGRLEEG